MEHRVLITGGGGLIGSHVAQQLTRLGHEVIVFDNSTSYLAVPSRTESENARFRRDVLLEGVQVVHGSVMDSDAMLEVVANTDPTRVLHLAATPLATSARARPIEAADTMVQGTLHLMQSLLTLPRPPRLVFASSSMAYGDFTSTPMREHVPMRPMDVYGALKLAGEALVQAFGRQFGLPFAIVRPSAVYGDGDSNMRVVQAFIEAALTGEMIEATDPDNTFLDFTHVSDAADAMVRTLLGEGLEGHCFNITRGEAHSLSTLIGHIRGHVPDVRVLERPRDSIRPRRGALDITQARKHLGYVPRMSLAEGVDRYISYMTENNSVSLGLESAAR